jgi:hypothetical protein
LLTAFTTFGAFVGLLTGIFTVWDRYARGRPIGYLVFRNEREELSPRLFVSNPGDYSVFIMSIKTIPEVFFLTRGLDMPFLIEDQLNGITYWPIEPKGSAEFLIAERFKNGLPLGLSDQRVCFSVDWRRGNTTWLWQLPVRVRTRTSTIRKIAKKA